MHMPATETDRVVDVRTIDDPPFDAILASLGNPTEDPVVFIDSDEPAALYEALDQRGLSYRTTRTGSGDWYVRVAAGEANRNRDRTARIDHVADLANPELL